MSTRRQVPTVLGEDPGPWSVTSSVFTWAGAPGRRRALPPMGLMISPAPTTTLVLAGLDAASSLAGVAPVAVVAGTREPAYALEFDGELLRGVSPYVSRSWSLPELELVSEERPGGDPAADLPPAIHPASLEVPDLPGVVVAPGGEYVGVHTRESRAEVIAIIRLADRAVVRWVRGARAIAWSPDGRLMALGDEWGVILTEVAS